MYFVEFEYMITVRVRRPVSKLGYDTRIGNRELGVGNRDSKYYSRFPVKL